MIPVILFTRRNLNKMIPLKTCDLQLSCSYLVSVLSIVHQAPKILPMCDYNHHRPNLALVGTPMVRWS